MLAPPRDGPPPPIRPLVRAAILIAIVAIVLTVFFAR